VFLVFDGDAAANGVDVGEGGGDLELVEHETGCYPPWIDDWPHEEVKEEANKYVGCLGHGNEPCRSETLFVILILA
jgi:hypothetical protein